MATDADDLAALRAERDALAREVEELRRRPAGLLRRAAVGVLLVVGWIALALAPVAVWARAQVLETDRWVAVAAPLSREPAVQAAIADWATERLVDRVQPEEAIQELLPERADPLAAPLSRAIVGFVHDQVLAVVRSDRFSELWARAVARAQEAAVRVLDGDAPNVTTGADTITLDLTPLLQETLDRIVAQAPELFRREITAPDVPEDLGQITVYDHGRLRTAQDVLHRLGRLVTLVVLVAVLAPLAAIALSPRRGRTAVLVVAGALVGAVLVRRAVGVLIGELLTRIARTDARGVAERLADRLVEPLLVGLGWIIATSAVILAVTYVLGSRRSARRLRAGVARGGRTSWAAARRHRPIAQVALATTGLVLLLVLDLGWLASLLLVLAVAAAVVAVSRVPAPAPPPSPPG